MRRTDEKGIYMHPSHLNERGEYTPETPLLQDYTVVFDRARNEQVMRIKGVVVLPVGAEVELTDPHVSAIVTGVRLLAGNKTTPVAVCLDVQVPAEYWGDER